MRLFSAVLSALLVSSTAFAATLEKSDGPIKVNSCRLLLATNFAANQSNRSQLLKQLHDKGYRLYSTQKLVESHIRRNLIREDISTDVDWSAVKPGDMYLGVYGLVARNVISSAPHTYAGLMVVDQSTDGDIGAGEVAISELTSKVGHLGWNPTLFDVSQLPNCRE